MLSFASDAWLLWDLLFGIFGGDFLIFLNVFDHSLISFLWTYCLLFLCTRLSISALNIKLLNNWLQCSPQMCLTVLRRNDKTHLVFLSFFKVWIHVDSSWLSLHGKLGISRCLDNKINQSHTLVADTFWEGSIQMNTWDRITFYIKFISSAAGSLALINARACGKLWIWAFVTRGLAEGRGMKGVNRRCSENSANVWSFCVFAHAVTFSFFSRGSRTQWGCGCLGLLSGMPSQPHAHFVSFHLLPLVLFWAASSRVIREGSLRSAPLFSPAVRDDVSS